MAVGLAGLVGQRGLAGQSPARAPQGVSGLIGSASRNVDKAEVASLFFRTTVVMTPCKAVVMLERL